MVTISRDDITVVAECAVCHEELDPLKRSVVVVSVPDMNAHMLCEADWTCLIVSAWNALKGFDDEDPLARRGRIQAAYRAFFGENG